MTARLCIAQPNRASYSESFVRAHAERLPAATQVIYGGWFPRWRDDGRPIMPSWLGFARLKLPALPALARPAARMLCDLALAWWLRRGRFDALLAEYGPTGAEVARACRLARLPLLVHFHGADAFDESILAGYRALYGPMFGLAHSVIAVSRAMERQLLELGAPRARLVYLPYGADTARFAPGDPAAAPAHFLAAGRFVDKKAPQLTLLAFARLHAAEPAARLTMAGDGPLLESCRRLAAALGLGEAGHFSGPLPQPELAELMARVRAFVQHSVRAASGDSEGTPVVILEAGAAGLPVVATRHGGIVDVVIEGETGLLVDEGDVAGMAGHLLALARDPALAARLGAQAAAHIRASFSQEHQLGALWALIRRAAARERP